jgi:hypothetical protein
VGWNDDIAQVQVGEAIVPARSPSGRLRDEAVRILVRPSGARIEIAPESTHLRGQIRDVSFSGRGYEHVIELGDGTALSESPKDRGRSSRNPPIAACTRAAPAG